MLKLELLNEDGKKVTYTKAHPTLRDMRLCASYYRRVEEELLVGDEVVDEAINTLIEVFNDPALTFDKVMDGLSPDDFNNVVMNLLFKVMDGETKKSGKSSRLMTLNQIQAKAQEELKTILKEKE